ncbi:MAG: hypothetical protein IJF78_14230 [Clostridia bacterium]|nr:hypothetical protein [Clostridia bacterium]
MIASQYIYTSWKNGDSTDKGFMVYFKSTDITETESDEIRYSMKYVVPGDLNPMPSAEEILNDFPFAFSYFRLSSGRECVAQSTYLGMDYSGRFGNYIISALVFDPGELDVYPAELFAEDCIRTFLTEEELNAPSPVPPLPKLEITDWGNAVNDEQIVMFLSGKENEFAYLISALMYAVDHDEVMFINDTRENLVMWFASLQRVFPLTVAKNLTFSTYIGNYKRFDDRTCLIRFACCGVRSGEYGYNYASGAHSAGNVVADFIGGHFTESIEVSDLAKMLANYCSFDPMSLDEWCGYLDRIGYTGFGSELLAAYDAYRLIRQEQITPDDRSMQQMLRFCNSYGDDVFRNEVGAQILEAADTWGLFSLETYGLLFPFLYAHTGFMVYSIHELYENALYEYSVRNSEECCRQILDLTETVSASQDGFRSFLKYLESDDCTAKIRTLLAENNKLHVNSFWAQFILRYYDFPDGMQTVRNASTILQTVFSGLARLDDSTNTVIFILEGIRNHADLLTDVIIMFLTKYPEGKLREGGPAFGKMLSGLPEAISDRILSSVLNNLQTSKFAVYLNAMYIQESAHPEKIFWSIYKSQFARNSQLDHVDIGDMISAGIRRGDPDEFVIQVLETIPATNISNQETIRLMLGTVQAIPLKKLKNQRKIVFTKILSLAQQAGLGLECDKVRAAAFLLELKNNSLKPSMIPPEVSISAESFEKKDYQELVDEAFVNLILASVSADDLRAVCHMLYHSRFFGYFTDMLIDYLKKTGRKGGIEWEKLNVIVCTYLIDGCGREKEADELYKEYSKYFRKLEDIETGNIKAMSLKNCKNRHTDFFDRINEKEGLGAKLSSLFKKK